MAGDYIPSNDAAFDNWFNFLNNYVAQKCGGTVPEWTHIPGTARTALAGAYSVWHAARAVTLGPRTKVDTEAKNDAKKAAKALLRPFVNQYLRYLPVTNEDRTAMNIPNRSARSAPRPPPEDIPEVEVRTPNPRVLSFRFRRTNMKRWGKPLGVRGIELVWVFSGSPPGRVEDLTHSVSATKSPLELVFEEDQRGRRLYYAARWETATGKKGNFSEIFSAFVP
ncbi:MAG: hypothetical protein LBJ24_08710 [Treponema sp.]|jgi:hypothetical protein|nr:hypothetical protein [Treponema sp.]